VAGLFCRIVKEAASIGGLFRASQSQRLPGSPLLRFNEAMKKGWQRELDDPIEASDGTRLPLPQPECLLSGRNAFPYATEKARRREPTGFEIVFDRLSRP